jgi:iron complex outermembrane receptor protein
MRKLLQSFVLPALFVLCAHVALAQKAVSGRVTDATGNGIPSVTVSVKGTSAGTSTDTSGSFSLTVPASGTTLVFSSVGYQGQEVVIGDRTEIGVTLQANAGNLNEVVVVAYGTRRRGDLTGSVTSISAKDFQKGVIPSSEQLLQGKVAGLQVTSGGGSAGGGSRIRIRGGASLNASNDPLIVIDGVPVESNGIAGSGNLLNTINPNDIESISVLKDASATALYGSRASNGVLIITTKKGSSGKVRFNYYTQASVGKIANKVDVLTADEIRKIITDDAAATGSNTYKNLLGTANTDWQDVVYQSAQGWDNTLSASGSLGKLPFRASLGYLTQEGILKTNKFDRLSTSLNLNPKLFQDHLAINVALKGSRTGNVWADEGGAVGNSVSFDPTQPVYADNKFGGYWEWLQADKNPIDLAGRNPLGLLELRDNTSNVNRFIGNVQLDYKLHFLPDLHVLLNLGMDVAKGEGNDNIDSLSATNYRTFGRMTYYQQKKQNTLADVQLFYAKELKSLRSKFDVLVGHSYQDFYTDVYNYPSFSQRVKANGLRDTIAGTRPTFATDKPQFRLESYLGRVNMTIADYYLVTASLRRDASSKFSPETRVGYFPAVALAWKLRDQFFNSSNVLSDLKFRFGWGETGQQDIGDLYPYLPRYGRSRTTASYQFGNTFYDFLRPAAYDENIKWETTTTTNLGFDFAFLQNRINGSVDVYQKKTKDLLSRIPVAPGSNFDIELLTNVGNMENKGVEFTLNTTPVRTQDLNWDFGFNFTYNKSEITNLLQQPDPNFKGIDVSGISGGTGNRVGKFAVGEAPYSYFVYQQVYDRDGKPVEGVYEDRNRDGKVDDLDRYLYKKPAADVLLGVSTQLTYKEWSLGLSGHGAAGNYLYNNFNSNAGSMRNIKDPLSNIRNVSRDFLNTRFNNNQYLSDYYIENASFFRLDNINIGYNFGRVFKDKAALRLQANVQNVFVISKYSGLDPENSSDTGVDNVIYPRPRVFAVGFNLDF